MRDDEEALGRLEPEMRPAVEALEMALALDTAADVRSLGHHESLAMFCLLGRRAASLAITPMAAHQLAPAILKAFTPDRKIVAEVGRTLALACLEGYVAGREDELREALGREAGAHLPSHRVAEGVLLLTLCGRHDAERISERAQEFGRELHGADASACVVDIGALVEPDLRRAAAVLEVDAAARMLGGRCFYAGVDADWRAAFAEAGVVETRDLANFEEGLEPAMQRALAHAGWTLRRPSRLAKILRRGNGT